MKIGIALVLAIMLLFVGMHAVAQQHGDHDFDHEQFHDSDHPSHDLTHEEMVEIHHGGDGFEHPGHDLTPEEMIELHHGDNQDHAAGPVTVSFAQNDDFYLCNDPFFAGAYEMLKEVYAVGIENVTVELLEERTFAFVRAWPEFTLEEAESMVEHVKAIPAQFVAIISEDPTVLDSCTNYSVAMVGPP